MEKSVFPPCNRNCVICFIEECSSRHNIVRNGHASKHSRCQKCGKEMPGLTRSGICLSCSHETKGVAHSS